MIRGWGKVRPELFCAGVLQYVGNVVAHPTGSSGAVPLSQPDVEGATAE